MFRVSLHLQTVKCNSKLSWFNFCSLELFIHFSCLLICSLLLVLLSVWFCFLALRKTEVFFLLGLIFLLMGKIACQYYGNWFKNLVFTLITFNSKYQQQKPAFLLFAGGVTVRKQSRHRVIIQLPANGGRECPDSLFEERECETSPVCHSYRYVKKSTRNSSDMIFKLVLPLELAEFHYLAVVAFLTCTI